MFGHPRIAAELSQLRAQFPGAKVTGQPSGAFLVEVPNVALPSGWSQPTVTILLWIPPGYPAAVPADFWLEPAGTKLPHRPMPVPSYVNNPIPGVGYRGQWYPMRLQDWRPNSDHLLRYAMTVRRRLRHLGIPTKRRAEEA